MDTQPDSLPAQLGTPPASRVKILGIGGAGSNIADGIKLANLDQVNLALVNTDSQALNNSPIDEKIAIGRQTTGGMSAGGEAEIGREAALEQRDMLIACMAGCDVIFLVAGLGGGTGSGAAPVVAELAQSLGRDPKGGTKAPLVISFVTTPFNREGARRNRLAADALNGLRKHCHAVIEMPNDLLIQQMDDAASLLEAFDLANQWIQRGINAICGLIFETGLMNVDLASVRHALGKPGGKTLFGFGAGRGTSAVEDALRDLEQCPLLHLPETKNVRRSETVIVNITGAPGLSFQTVNRVLDYVAERFGSKDNTVTGAVVDSSVGDELQITIIGRAGNSHKRFSGHSVPAASAPPPEDALLATPAVAKRGKSSERRIMRTRGKRLAAAHSIDQGEFAFPSAKENRGFFEPTNKNIYDGQDLDVPTFLRRGERIPYA